MPAVRCLPSALPFAIALAVVAVGLADPGQAADVGPSSASLAERFAAADANGDGGLDRAELEQAGAARASERAGALIERADRDGDGRVTQDELAALRDGRGGSQRDAWLTRLAGEDGRVTREEWVDGAAARFDGLDADKDGALTVEEMRAGRGRR